MLFAETHLKNIGVEEVGLKARETALPFYQKLGYQSFGDQFIEVTIHHFWMKKFLINSCKEH
ncbi:MAG: GNAT family N-acetyltransferase [Candidatus Caenarcaniphilales bacterium]|nr:GNAT family N-acetyltransferase [Candidatus Caenarcaniphilales bacterium]